MREELCRGACIYPQYQGAIQVVTPQYQGDNQVVTVSLTVHNFPRHTPFPPSPVLQEVPSTVNVRRRPAMVICVWLVSLIQLRVHPSLSAILFPES